MGFENEKRFLVRSMDRSIFSTGLKKESIQQGYFEIMDPKRFRIRITEGEEAEITFKEGAGFSRPENNFQVIDLNLARVLLLNSNHKLKKIRYFPEYPATDAIFMIDVFESPLTNLIFAELEYRDTGIISPPKYVEKPSWIYEWKDITDSISNYHIARMATEMRILGETKLSAQRYNYLLAGRLFKIILTGGPCSGKSKIMEKIKEKMGNKIQCVPEVARILISQVGINPKNNPNRFNLCSYRVQSVFESTSEEEAKDNGMMALLLDRGTPDNAAYDKNGWASYSKLCNTTMAYEFSQYNLVICLDIPSKRIYEESKNNNPSRTETYEEAFILGEKIKRAYEGHPNFHIIPQTKTLEEKEQMVIDIINQYIN